MTSRLSELIQNASMAVAAVAAAADAEEQYLVSSSADRLLGEIGGLRSMVEGAPPAEHLQDLCVIVVGDNHCWGKGEDLDESLNRAFRPRRYVVYVAHKDTSVSELDGSLSYPVGFAPKIVVKRGIK